MNLNLNNLLDILYSSRRNVRGRKSERLIEDTYDQPYDKISNYVNSSDQKYCMVQKCIEKNSLYTNTHQRSLFGTNRWRSRRIAELNSSIYNLKITPDQRSMLVGTQDSMSLFNCENGIAFVQSFIPDRIRWTMTDTDISDDSTIALSCSLNPYVTLYDLCNSRVLAELNLNSDDQQDDEDFYGLRFYTMKMSHDKATLLGGSGTFQQGQTSYIKYFDIVKNKTVHSIPAHNQDINSIGFIQRNTSSVFISGSDDSFVKIWDTRTLGFTKKPVGKFYGHFSGVTTVASRNDGIYACSNGKDQSLKLWDLRNMSNEDNLPHKPFLYDYRYDRIGQDKLNEFQDLVQRKKHTDQSVASYSSHRVLRTLIRCHFSPQETTNSEYIVSGSACGRIFIYSIYEPQRKPIIISNNTVKQRIQLDSDDIITQKKTADQQEYQGDDEDDQEGTIIRDLAWTDTGIITGDFQGIIREFRQY